MSRDKKRGITLMELVVVMAIIAIGAVLLAPNIAAWIPNYRLRGASRDIVSALRTAQMKAISNNVEYDVVFNQAAGSYVIQHQNTSDGPSQTLPPGIVISGITFAGSKANFNTNSTSSGGSIILQNSKGNTKRISVTPATGRINVQD